MIGFYIMVHILDLFLKVNKYFILLVFDDDMNPFTLGVCDFEYKWKSKTFNVI